MKQDQIIGCILGCAVGDALGLPYEGLSPTRAERMLGAPDRYRLVFRRGMISDDTEHTCMVAQALIACGGDVTKFQKRLAWAMRWWLLRLPAGIGFATLRAIIRLWFGISPEKSGVFSAGNGPAMRAGVLGAAIDDPDVLLKFVRISTRMTHTDPKAEYGAFAIAFAVQLVQKNSGMVSGEMYLETLAEKLGPDANELLELLSDVVLSVNNNQTTIEFARTIGLSAGVTGYVYHTVPIAIHSWLSNKIDFRRAIMSVIECGGDTDTVAAITGSIVGSACGKSGIPTAWLDGIVDWPCSTNWMEKLGIQLYESDELTMPQSEVVLPVLGVMARNLLFTMIVLIHGFRRLAPPY